VKNLLGTCIVWLSFGMIVVGAVGFFALNFFHGPDTGAPHNLFAGLIMLRWMLETPVALLCFALFMLGGLGLAAGATLVKKPKR
jgi:hypothetical protein